MNPLLYDDAVNMMACTGGGFVQALAQCYYKADATNRERLREAFADYFWRYEGLFQEHCAFIASREKAKQ